jgi:hypothetical protein
VFDSARLRSEEDLPHLSESSRECERYSDDESEELFHQKFKLLIELFEVKRCGVAEFDTAIANFTRGCKYHASVTMILECMEYHVARSILLLDSKLIEVDLFTQVAT